MIKGIVNNAQTKALLPFVNITIADTKMGTSSDIDGKFQLLVPPSVVLRFSFIGYQSKNVLLDTLRGDFIRLSLHEKISQLREVNVLPGVNPAHRIIQNTIDNRKLNNPLNLISFTYKSYSKFIMAFKPGLSLKLKLDTIKINDYTKADSSNYRLISLMEKQDLFLMENITERKFLAPSRDNETVIANRTSGFKNPLFALIAIELRSFSFYKDYIEIAGKEYLNPITPGSLKRYFFLLEDTLYNSVSDTVFIISFRPQPGYGFEPLKGSLYINSSSWAIQNVLAEPYENEGIQVKIQQQYQRFGEKTWFPVQLNADFIFYTSSGINPYATLRTYLSDINIEAELSRKDIDRVNLSIDALTHNNSLEIIDRHRVSPLTDKNKETYRVIDSIGEAIKLDERLEDLIGFLKGKIPIKFINLEVKKVLNYNTYEGLRLGLGGHTNNRISRIFSVGGYFGYGLKDKTWKYGLHARTIINRKINLSLKGGYFFDILESGGLDFTQKPSKGIFEGNYRRLYIENWDEVKRLWMGMEYHPFPQLQTRWNLQNETRYIIKSPYTYRQVISDVTFSPAKYNYTEFIGSFRYAPLEKYTRTPIGIIPLKRGFPVFYVQITQGFKELWNGDYSYQKIDFRMEYEFRHIYWGKSIFVLQSGKVFNNTPYSKLYAHQANMINSDDFGIRLLSLTDENSFETMRFNEFLSDTYIYLSYCQDFGSLLFNRRSFKSDIGIVNRLVIGNLSNSYLHQGIEFNTLESGYFESGIELNKLVYIGFIELGAGIFYRYGTYSLSQFTDNLAIKLNLSFGF